MILRKSIYCWLCIFFSIKLFIWLQPGTLSLFLKAIIIRLISRIFPLTLLLEIKRLYLSRTYLEKSLPPLSDQSICTIHRENANVTAIMNSCKYKWAFLLKILNRKKPSKLQDNFLFQCLVLLQRVTYTWNHVKHMWNFHVNSKIVHIEDLRDYFSLCIGKYANTAC